MLKESSLEQIRRNRRARLLGIDSWCGMDGLMRIAGIVFISRFAIEVRFYFTIMELNIDI